VTGEESVDGDSGQQLLEVEFVAIYW
ncbi:MAG: hypothetical protein JWQ91_1119, partial [Aeromicrobium sp.]|nr:hypothetical protein [Aeromicrobium sp.]